MPLGESLTLISRPAELLCNDFLGCSDDTNHGKDSPSLV